MSNGLKKSQSPTVNKAADPEEAADVLEPSPEAAPPVNAHPPDWMLNELAEARHNAAIAEDSGTYHSYWHDVIARIEKSLKEDYRMEV